MIALNVSRWMKMVYGSEEYDRRSYLPRVCFVSKEMKMRELHKHVFQLMKPILQEWKDWSNDSEALKDFDRLKKRRRYCYGEADRAEARFEACFADFE